MIEDNKELQAHPEELPQDSEAAENSCDEVNDSQTPIYDAVVAQTQEKESSAQEPQRSEDAAQVEQTTTPEAVCDDFICLR